MHRSLLAALLLGSWLLIIASRQVALYRGAGGGPPGADLVSVPVIVAAVLIAVAARIARPSVVTHVACLAVVVGAVALLAASLRSPFANATASYCGDFCRTAIMGRFLAFFGWSPLTALGLVFAWRVERSRQSQAALERAAWSHAWIYPTLVLGFGAAIIWWRTVLP